jgi:uncharacterized protein (TIGR00251 family)
MKKNVLSYPKCIKLNKKNGVILKFSAKPNSNISKIIKIDDDEITIQISEPPVNDKANIELLQYLSKAFSISKSQIKLIKGEKSKEKIVEIEDVDIKSVYNIINEIIKDE